MRPRGRPARGHTEGTRSPHGEPAPGGSQCPRGLGPSVGRTRCPRAESTGQGRPARPGPARRQADQDRRGTAQRGRRQVGGVQASRAVSAPFSFLGAKKCPPGRKGAPRNQKRAEKRTAGELPGCWQPAIHGGRSRRERKRRGSGAEREMAGQVPARMKAGQGGCRSGPGPAGPGWAAGRDPPNRGQPVRPSRSGPASPVRPSQPGEAQPFPSGPASPARPSQPGGGVSPPRPPATAQHRWRPYSPLPAAVTACRYVWSWTSPQANTPGTLVAVDPAAVSRYPASSMSSWPAKTSELGTWPMATNTPDTGKEDSSPVIDVAQLEALDLGVTDDVGHNRVPDELDLRDS